MRDVTIGSRLADGFGTVIALLVLLTAVGLNRISAVLTNTQLILDDRYAKVAAVQTIESEVNRELQAVQTALITTDVAMLKREVATVTCTILAIPRELPVIASMVLITSPMATPAVGADRKLSTGSDLNRRRQGAPSPHRRPDRELAVRPAEA